MNILGCDISLNHAGFVQMNEAGKVTWLHLVTDQVGVHKHQPSRTTLLKLPPVADKGVSMVRRLAWWEEYIAKLMAERNPTHVGIEDYAIRAEGNAVYQIGEQGGLARLAALRAGASLRLHDPLSVKMFGALSGNATPPDLADAVQERFGITFEAFNLPAKKGKAPKRDPEFDLTSAYVVARLVWTEVKLRAGEMALKDLNEKEIQVFNRVTKTYPVNILAREWIKAA